MRMPQSGRDPHARRSGGGSLELLDGQDYCSRLVADRGAEFQRTGYNSDARRLLAAVRRGSRAESVVVSLTVESGLALVRYAVSRPLWRWRVSFKLRPDQAGPGHIVMAIGPDVVKNGLTGQIELIGHIGYIVWPATRGAKATLKDILKQHQHRKRRRRRLTAEQQAALERDREAAYEVARRGFSAWLASPPYVPPDHSPALDGMSHEQALAHFNDAERWLRRAWRRGPRLSRLESWRRRIAHHRQLRLHRHAEIKAKSEARRILLERLSTLFRNRARRALLAPRGHLAEAAAVVGASVSLPPDRPLKWRTD